MHLTVLGIVILPFSLVWAFQPLRLVQLALIAAVFEAGAAVAIGGFGLPLAIVPGLLFIGYVVLQYAIGMRYAAEGRALLTLMPLLALLLYALLSVVLLPNLFAGRIMVWPQKADPIDPSFVPLTLHRRQHHANTLPGDERYHSRRNRIVPDARQNTVLHDHCRIPDGRLHRGWNCILAVRSARRRHPIPGYRVLLKPRLGHR